MNTHIQISQEGLPLFYIIFFLLGLAVYPKYLKKGKVYRNDIE